MIKKYILVIASAAVAFVACQDELNTDDRTSGRVSDVTFVAMNETEDAMVRSSLHETSEVIY